MSAFHADDPIRTPGPRCGGRWLRLAWHQRAAVVSRHYADLSEHAVADALGCSVGTVRWQQCTYMVNIPLDSRVRLWDGILAAIR